MSEMRILTVRQPWAWAIIHGEKDVENRVRNVAGSYRGPVAIHVSLRDDDEAFEIEHPMYGMLFGPCPHTTSRDHNIYHCEWCTKVAPSKYGYKGHIIGVVDLVDVHGSGACWEDDMHRLAALYRKTPEEVTALPDNGGGIIGRVRHCSPWGQDDAYHLVLANPRPLSEPIPYKGALGLRRFDSALIDGRVTS